MPSKQIPRYILIDIDNTLFPYFFATKVMENQAQHGLIPHSTTDELTALLTRYKKGELAYVPTIDKWNHLWAASLAGKPLAAVQAIDRAFAEQNQSTIRPFFRDLIAATRDHPDIQILLVTSEPQNTAEILASVLGIAGGIGSDYIIDQHGIFTGKHHSMTSPADKPRAILAKGIQKSQIIAAFGDSISDLGMLELAQRPIVFSPNPEFHTYAAKRNWLILDSTAHFADYAHLILP